MGWLPPSSPHWRALRKLCSGELFAPHRLDAHQSIRREKVQQLASHVARLSREGAAVDASRGVFTTALNLLSCTIFSADIIDLDDREGTGQFRAMIASFTEVVGLPNLSDFFHVLVKIRFESLTDKSKFDTQPKLFIHLALVPDTLNHRQRRRHDQVSQEISTLTVSLSTNTLKFYAPRRYLC
ncbi:ferruginol synthase-like isoform X2 [Triticum urartu]|uniref:Uncharacterized protein n=1 Tax=Triticum urartu TaxID=4572 RepID=A0A8R7TU19_TRIUA|nr:ferruginol synthase-like [Triticum aestivum]XP_048563299.1 ferruginol synthase-like isoform X2 [Triticum urartu]XP_048563301.1 ferruginol synthase-like isoform X2 [Triticum urartu]XP_048563459.1 ferruginol synthase-like isoform X2 [Triticum urartu]XP_048563460.1 ferruginol synthase-like isoform X2 [Triticum urartu]